MRLKNFQFLSALKTGLIFSLVFSSFLLIFPDQVKAQNNPLDFYQILRGLLTKGSTAETENFESRMKYIIETARRRGINFQMNSYRENFLRNVGASEELIYSLRQAKKIIKNISSESAEAYFRRAVACPETDTKCRINNYTKALQINPKYVDAYNNRGLIYKNMGLTEMALADYSRAIEFSPNYALVYINRGALYEFEKNYKLAINDYSQSIAINPRFATAYNNRGLAYFNLGNNQQALDDYNKAIEFNPKYIDAYLNRQQVYESLGEQEKARADFQKAKILQALVEN